MEHQICAVCRCGGILRQNARTGDIIIRLTSYSKPCTTTQHRSAFLARSCLRPACPRCLSGAPGIFGEPRSFVARYHSLRYSGVVLRGDLAFGNLYGQGATRDCIGDGVVRLCADVRALSDSLACGMDSGECCMHWGQTCEMWWLFVAGKRGFRRTVVL